jgi:hypothetical protein
MARRMRSPESLAAEALVLDDLKAVQVFVRDVLALGTRTEILDRAIPVLVRHLAQDHPDDVLFDIGFVLCTKLARPYWGTLRDIYVRSDRPVVQDRLAAILGEIALAGHFEDLERLLADRSRGASRVLLVAATRRAGNRTRPGLGDDTITRFSDDPDLAVCVHQVLRRN